MRISDGSSDVCASDLQTGKIDDARLVELPHQTAHLSWGQCDHIRFRMFHAWHFPHLSRMGLQIGNGADYHFMGNIPLVLDEESDSFSRFHLNRSEEHASELQSLMRISYAVFCLKKKK